jgi:hypothetical protein
VSRRRERRWERRWTDRDNSRQQAQELVHQKRSSSRTQRVTTAGSAAVVVVEHALLMPALRDCESVLAAACAKGVADAAYSLPADIGIGIGNKRSHRLSFSPDDDAADPPAVRWGLIHTHREAGLCVCLTTSCSPAASLH